MRRQRDAAFTDEIITNIKQFQTDTDCDKPDERTVSHAKEKTVNPIVTGQKNVGQLGNNRAHRDGSIDVTERYIRPSKVPYLVCDPSSRQLKKQKVFPARYYCRAVFMLLPST